MATGTAAAAISSDKRLRCAGIAKNLSFELAAQTRYSLQISGSLEPTIDLLVTAPEYDSRQGAGTGVPSRHDMSPGESRLPLCAAS